MQAYNRNFLAIMNDINLITEKLLEFRKKRDWKKFHKPKDLVLSLVLEAVEVLEQFQWKSEKEAKKHINIHKEELSEELADVFNWVLIIAHDFKIDIIKASKKKINKNNQKYPIEKAKGKHTKYSNL